MPGTNQPKKNRGNVAPASCRQPRREKRRSRVLIEADAGKYGYADSAVTNAYKLLQHGCHRRVYSNVIRHAGLLYVRTIRSERRSETVVMIAEYIVGLHDLNKETDMITRILAVAAVAASVFISVPAQARDDFDHGPRIVLSFSNYQNVWVPGYWVRHGHRHVWVEGYWSRQRTQHHYGHDRHERYGHHDKHRGRQYSRKCG